MSWKRFSHRKSLKQVRHARVSLCTSHCEDCGTALHVTHQVSLFGGRCSVCWSVVSHSVADVLSFDAFAQMASQ